MNWVIIGGVSAAVVAKLAVGSRLLMQAQLVSKLPGKLRELCSRRDLHTNADVIQLRPGVVANPSTPDPDPTPSSPTQPQFRKKLASQFDTIKGRIRGLLHGKKQNKG